MQTNERAALRGSEQNTSAASPPAGTHPVQGVEDSYAGMRKSIRSWGMWLILWAVLNVVSGWNIAWGIILGLVALMTFYFVDVAAMFLVYTGVMLWAALWNLLMPSTTTGWGIFGGLQIIFAVLTYRDFRRFRYAKAERLGRTSGSVASDLSPSERDGNLAWIAALLAAFSLLGLCGMVPAAVMVESVPDAGMGGLMYGAIETALELGVLGIPVGIAALVAGLGRKWAAITGVVVGVISMLVMVLLLLLPA